MGWIKEAKQVTKKKVDPYTDYKSVGCYERVPKDSIKTKIDSVFNELVGYLKNL